MNVFEKLMARAHFKTYLRLFRGAKRAPTAPAAGFFPERGALTLTTTAESERAFAEASRIGLPLHNDRPKNWDTLLAVSQVLPRLTTEARVLDAGATLYSMFLPSLFLLGLRDLHGVNLVFDRPVRLGPVSYLPGDLTKTSYPDAHFDVVSCLSVIEHGVPLDDYFREARRLLKPGGRLVTSFDYWQDPIDTKGQKAYGADIRIFTRSDVLGMVELAARHGLTPVAPISERDLDCAERVVHWQRYDLRYTFGALVLERKA